MRTLGMMMAVILAGCVGLSPAPDTDVIAAAVAAPERSDADRERDARDHPDALLRLLDLRPGMTVVDAFGGGGYYSELAARVVGDGGRVWLVNNAPYARYAAKSLTPRLAGNRLPGVTATVVANEDLELASGQADVVLLIMTLHDLFYADPENDWPRIDSDQFLAQLYAALKPGGRLLITDHAAAAGSGLSVVKSLHRIEESAARAAVEQAGFVLDSTWDGQRNPADTHELIVFDPQIRGHTDRFVHVYRKPGAAAGRFF